MLDEITGGLTTALTDWAHWETWARYVTAAGLAYVLPRGAWMLAKDTGKLAVFAVAGLGRAALAVRAWWRRPSAATMIHQLVQTQLHVNDKLAKLEARLNFDGVGGRTVSAEQAALLGKVGR